MRQIFILKSDVNEPNIIELKTNNIDKYNSNFLNHPYKYTNNKKLFIKALDNFCNQVKYNNIEEYINNSEYKYKKNHGKII